MNHSSLKDYQFPPGTPHRSKESGQASADKMNLIEIGSMVDFAKQCHHLLFCFIVLP